MRQLLARKCVAALVALTSFSCADVSDPATTGGPPDEAEEIPPDEVPPDEVDDVDVDDEDHSLHEAASDYVWDDSSVVEIVLEGTTATVAGVGARAVGGSVVIEAAGNYAVSGVLDDGQIVVNSHDAGPVRLILEGVDITCSRSSPIYVKNAAKVIVVLANDSENTLTDGATYVFEDAVAMEPSATIFSHEDLSIFGDGALTIAANFQDGIASKDGLVINGGNIVVSAVDDAVRGKDYLVIRAGAFELESGADGIKASGDPDAGLGYVLIDEGTIRISAGDDGIHAEGANTINGGSIDVVRSVEGIEGRVVTINGGDIHVSASDDGIGAADGTDSGQTGETPTTSEISLNITGGRLVVESAGDGLDSNRHVEISGGTTIVHAPFDRAGEPLDYDGDFSITGGTLVAVGAAAKNDFSSARSTQNLISINLAELQAASALLNLRRSNGDDILTFVPQNQYQSLVFSSELLVSDSYDLLVGGASTGESAGGLVTGGTVDGGVVVESFSVSGSVTLVGAQPSDGDTDK